MTPIRHSLCSRSVPIPVRPRPQALGVQEYTKVSRPGQAEEDVVGEARLRTGSAGAQ